MIQSLLLVSVLSFLGLSQVSTATSLDQIKEENHVLLSMTRTVAHRREQYNNQLIHASGDATAKSDTLSLRRAVDARSSMYGSHVILWGSNTDGCSFTTPKATISCGSGGILTLIGQDPSVQSCTLSSNRNSVVCTSVANPFTSPRVIIVCTGSTAAAIAATLRIPASTAKCSKKVSSTAYGGTAAVFGSLGRYCVTSSGNDYQNFYACTSGVKNSTGGLGFCSARGTCKTSLSTSCTTSIGAVVTSDTDSRSECINKGPDNTAEPFAIHAVAWNASAVTCTLVANTITLVCASGGTISVEAKGAGVSTCTKPDKSTMKCTKFSTAAVGSANVVFRCTGRGVGQLTATATLPSVTATKCTSTFSPNVGSQYVYMSRDCTDGVRLSSACGKSTQLFYDQGQPYCASSNKCTSTSTSKCSLTLASVSISDYTPDNLCIFL